MNELRIIDNSSRREWESFLQSFSGNLSQSFDYGEVKKSAPHTRVMRLSATNRDSLVGLVQGTYQQRFGGGGWLDVGGLWGYGPVVDSKDEEHILRELMLALEKAAIKNRVPGGVILRPSRSNLLEHSGYSLSSVYNIYTIALRSTSEELWKNIAHNKRRNIKMARERGVEVASHRSYDALVRFYDLYQASSKRVGFASHPLDYFHSYLRIFGKNDKARVFFTVFHDQPVASAFIVVHGNTAYALAAGSQEKFWHVRPNDILHWEAMEWARSEGLSLYHLGHVYEPLPVENSPTWSLWRWKREWNGQLEKVYIYNKIYMAKFKKLIVDPYEKICRIARARALTRTGAAMLGLRDQYRCPTGRPGRLVAKLMNQEHEPLTLWGLTTVKIASDDVILDVGCGGGKTVNRLAQQAPQGKVFGIDYSADMVEYSKKVNKKLIAQNHVQIVEGSVEKMSFPNDYFDLVTAFETYYFWPSFRDALEEIKRVLKPGGKLLLVNEMVQDGVYEVKYAQLIEETHMRLIPLEEIRNAMRSVGFVGVQVFTKAESPWNAVLAQKQSG